MKLKKFGLIITIAVLLLNFSFTITAAAHTATPPNAADSCLLETIDLMFDEEIESIYYSRQNLYNDELQEIGYAYDININNKTAYALMIKNGYYEVTEFYFKNLPFKNITGIPVYLTSLNYLEYIDGKFFDVSTGIEINEIEIYQLKKTGFGFQGDTLPGQLVSESIYYDSRTVEAGTISGKIPCYVNVSQTVTNSCAVTAGSVAIGYYGRYFPELVPGFTVGRMLGSTYYYYDQSQPSKIQFVIDDLYVRMGTNIGGDGTTAAGFRNGLQSYVNSKGLNVTYTSVVSNTVLDYNAYKTHISNLKPVVLFLNTYNFTDEGGIRQKEGYDYLERKIYSGLHAVISYGYQKIMYYKNGSNFRTDYYLRIATGYPDIEYGMVKLYDNAIIQEAYAINIY